MKIQQDIKTSRLVNKFQLTKLFTILLAFFLSLSSCEEENFLPEENITSFNEFSTIQNSFNPENINKSLKLGKDNFQVNWNNYQIINFNKSTKTTTYEFDVLLKREAKLQSNLFSGEIIYKLIVTEENKQNYTFNILRFEPYKTSQNKNPGFNNIENFDGLKFTLLINGKIKDIQTYEKGIVIASFKKDILEKPNNSDDLNKESVYCDLSSFYYDSKKCGDYGDTGGAGGWVIETTVHWVDWYKSLDGGITYYQTHRQDLANTYRWVYIPGGFNFYVNSFTSDGDHQNINYPPFTGDRIFNELTGKADCIYDMLNELSESFAAAIKKFDGEFPVSHLKFENSSSLPNNINAKTVPPSNYLITI